MKKLISFAVAVLMLLSLSIPMTFAANPTVAGKADAVGSVVGLTVDDVAITSSEDYIAKMGYATDSNWTAIETVQDLKDNVSKGGNFYLANPLVFAEADNVKYEGEAEAMCKNIGSTTHSVIDGCGYSITGIDIKQTKMMLFYVSDSRATLEIKNLCVGTKTAPAKMDGGSAFGFSVFGNTNGTVIFDNVSVWANFKTTGAGNLAGFIGYAGNNAKIQINNSEMNGKFESGQTNNVNIGCFVTGIKGNVTLTNCVNNATVTLTTKGSASQLAAGFAANSAGTITMNSCQNKGTITANTSESANDTLAGFFVSCSGNVTLNGCVNEAEITATHTGASKSPTAAGFFTGCTSNVYLNDCVNNADITLNSDSGNGVAGIGTTISNQKEKTITLTRCINNGNITHNGSARVGNGVAGILATALGYKTTWFTMEQCVNNGVVMGYDVVGGIGSTTYDYHNRKVFNSNTNNGTVIATGGVTAHGIYAAENRAFQDSNNIASNTNTGMVTKFVDGVKTTEIPTGANEPKAFIQMTEGATQDVRFILALSEAEYAEAASSLSFKISFKMTDGNVRSKNFSEIVAFDTVETDEETFVAADGVVFCGVIVTDVVAAEWTKCGISYGGDTWAYAK